MSGDTHAAVGAGASLAVACTIGGSLMYGNKESAIVGAGVAAIGAIFADLDSKKSKGNKLLNSTLLMIGIVAVFFAVAHFLGVLNIQDYFKLTEKSIATIALLGIAVYSRTRPHREMTHSFVLMLITTLCVYCMFNNSFWLWYAIGYVSHLIIDFPNDKGECLFWPAPKRCCLHLCSSNGTVNKVLKWMGAAVAVVCVMFL